jgi:hypothetical protein
MYVCIYATLHSNINTKHYNFAGELMSEFPSSNYRNEYQGSSWGVKGGQQFKANILTAICELIV